MGYLALLRVKEPGRFSPAESLCQSFQIFWFFILAWSCFPLVFVYSWHMSPIPFRNNKSKKIFNSSEVPTSQYIILLFSLRCCLLLHWPPIPETLEKCLNMYLNFSVILISFFTFTFLIIFGEIHSVILPDLSHTWVFYISHMPVSQPLITFSHLYLPTLTLFTF